MEDIFRQRLKVGNIMQRIALKSEIDSAREHHFRSYFNKIATNGIQELSFLCSAQHVCLCADVYTVSENATPINYSP